MSEDCIWIKFEDLPWYFALHFQDKYAILLDGIVLNKSKQITIMYDKQRNTSEKTYFQKKRSKQSNKKIYPITHLC